MPLEFRGVVHRGSLRAGLLTRPSYAVVAVVSRVLYRVRFPQSPVGAWGCWRRRLLVRARALAQLPIQGLRQRVRVRLTAWLLTAVRAADKMGLGFECPQNPDKAAISNPLNLKSLR